MQYRMNENFSINVGFIVTANQILEAAVHTNKILEDLPSTLFKSIDYKTTSSMIGSVFCDNIANVTGALVNPIEKGHPDIIPSSAHLATEEQLRNYPEGLEIKCTIGNIETGANLRAGEVRIGRLTGITWQAHHREVEALLGVIWDFIDTGRAFNYPTITGVFYTDILTQDDWGEISGTTGRNTKVTGMRATGKAKMGSGWVLLINSLDHLEKYQRFLSFSSASSEQGKLLF